LRDQRLLERIQSWKSEPKKRSRGDPGRTIDSVLMHLERILNTRQGSVPIAEDYGIPDFTSFLDNYPDSLRDFERSIRQSIQKYEPRLKAIRVRFEPDEEDPLSLRFQIVGKLISDDYKEQIRFESVMGSEGKIKIRR